MGSIDEVRDNLRIRVAAKYNSGIAELTFQIDMILDNAVVNYGHVSGKVWMRILLTRATMSCPSSVPNSDGAVERPAFERTLQLIQLARGAHDLNIAVHVHGNACRVVAAVFQSPQALQKNWRNA